MEASILTTHLNVSSKIASEYYYRFEKMSVFRHVDTTFTARHIVSAASCTHPCTSRRLVRAKWLCRGLGQTLHLSAAKSVEKRQSKIKNSSSKNRGSKGKIRKHPASYRSVGETITRRNRL